ncbi:hypothetical protein PR202_ga05288 [Eleusine coracana subsp. coracana]|uniref:DYW domain-containing protein n=1 Tax=Eleusine coracana subsp. coracana TaxID=191504 RepID=A0AAV5BS03_ELECO|nr:hypothetical protein PR202_ga04835 [Eleusine coracana subsp. coracana]GJM89137.1 hypothetical protein PR202_ga05288 [Eleusine coracana subsp. coracana]
MIPRASLALRRSRSTATLAPNHAGNPLAIVACSVQSEYEVGPRDGPRARKAFDEISHRGAAAGSDRALFDYARGYAQAGAHSDVMGLFFRMQARGIWPNSFTFTSVLSAVASHGAPEVGRCVHAQSVKFGCRSTVFVCNSLMNMYAKCGLVEEAKTVFSGMETRDVVAWSAMLTCYAQAGDSDGATSLFIEMTTQGLKPNEFTISSAIDACACPAAGVDLGRQFHAVSIKYRYQDAICVSSALVSMYARKGSIENAQSLFLSQTDRDLVSWNSMISGYAQHGYSKKALDTFRQMEAEGIEMDGITFLAVIIGCTHAGLVEEGQRCFDSMVRDHKINPNMEHYACMVDLYSRAGKLDETMSFIGSMPFPAAPAIWRTLLGACRVHKNVELGKLVAEKLLSLEPLDSATYVLLSNIYSAAGKWKERDEMRKLMDTKKVKKEAGCSWIQIKNKVHSFIASDKSHPLSEQIYAKLKEMTARLKQEGYCPDTSFVLHDMPEEKKETMLSMHSERLALALGLISTPPGTPLQIVKNLRVCGDCHTVIKMVSKIEHREIIMRDFSRFHHFNSGTCSCGDFW